MQQCSFPKKVGFSYAIFQRYYNYFYKVLAAVHSFNGTVQFLGSWYSHGSNLPLILNDLQHDMRKLLYWFKINLLKANPGKFQSMILGKKKRLKCTLKFGSISIKESDEVELLGITINKALNLKNMSKIYVALPSTSLMLLDESENTWH